MLTVVFIIKMVVSFLMQTVLENDMYNTFHCYVLTRNKNSTYPYAPQHKFIPQGINMTRIPYLGTTEP